MWPLLTVQKSSSSPTKTGLYMHQSAMWLPSHMGSLWNITSPGFTSPAKYFATALVARMSEPRWIGRSWPWTIIAGSQLKIAFEKSRETVRTLDRPVRSIVRVISRCAVSSAPRTTASVIGSTINASACRR